MTIGLAILHPSEGEQQSVTIFLAVSQFPVPKGIRLINGTILNHLIAGEDRIVHVHILIRRTHLYGHGRAVIGELAMRDIEPVIRLGRRSLVIEREHHEVLLQGILAADSFQPVFTTLQISNGNSLVRSDRLPVQTAFTFWRKAITHLSIQVGSGRIDQMEFHAFNRLLQDFIEHLHGESRRFISQRQRQCAVMRFSSLVCDIGRDHKVIEHRIACLGHHDRHRHRKHAVLVRCHLAFRQDNIIRILRPYGIVPVV